MGNVVSETTFDHWKADLSWGKVRKTRFSQNPLNPQFWALGFWIYTSSCANFKKILRDIFNESHCMFLPLVAILSIGLDKMLLSGNDGKNKKSKQRWWFTVGGLRKTTARAALSQSRPPNSEKRSCKCSFLSFHSPSSYIFIFFFIFEPPLSIFSKFSHFFRITLSVSQGVRQTKSFAIYGVFFIYSPQFSAPKLKMSCSQQWRKLSK